MRNVSRRILKKPSRKLIFAISVNGNHVEVNETTFLAALFYMENNLT